MGKGQILFLEVVFDDTHEGSANAFALKVRMGVPRPNIAVGVAADDRSGIIHVLGAP